MSNDSFYVRSIAAGMGEAVAQRTILRKQPDGSWETWKQVSERVALGNSLLAPEAERDAEYTTLRNHIAKATVLMSGRHLQHGDAQQPSKSQEVFVNCATAATSATMFYLLMNGSGVGRCYDDDIMLIDFDNAPNIRCVLDSSHPDFDFSAHESVRDAQHKYGNGPNVAWHTVEDSREGWTKAVEIWETMAFEKIHRDKLLILDFSNVRPNGSPIAGMQGRPASGPVALMNAFIKCAGLKGARLPRWRQAMYIDHYMAECVLVGGVRRCLPGETLVALTNGAKPIRDVVVGDTVKTVRGNKKVTAVFKQGVQQTIKIRHQFGVFECTPNHRVAVFSSLHDWYFKEAADLQPGDRLVFDRSGWDSNTPVALPSYQKTDTQNSRYNTTGTDITIPELDTGISWLLGMVLGNGYVYLNNGHGSVDVATHVEYPQIAEQAKEQLERFGVVAKIKDLRPLENTLKTKVTSVQLGMYFHTEIKQAKTALCVPDCIKHASRELRWAFVAGLFDADGSSRNRPLTMCCTIYPEFAEDLRLLLLSLGVISHVRVMVPREENWKPKYYVYIKGMENFDIVNSEFAKFSKKYEKSMAFSNDGFSFPTGFVRKELKGHWITPNANQPTDRMTKLAGVKFDAYPVRVDEIELGRMTETYDIEVEDIHQFTAEGFVVHNSARMSTKHWTDPAVIDFISIKRPIEYTGKAAKDILLMRADDPNPPFGFLWSSNNSITVDKEFWALVKAAKSGSDVSDKAQHALSVFTAATEASYADGTGEPGFINSDMLTRNDAGWKELLSGDWVGSNKYQVEDDTRVMLSKLAKVAGKKKNCMIVNPCSEIPLTVLSGFCTIGDVVPYHADTIDEAEDAIRATVRALIRVNSMDSLYRAEVRRTNRIGVGLTGIHEFAWKFFGYGFKDLIDEAKSKDFWLTLARFNRAAYDEAVTYSKHLGVSVPHTITTVKPSGSVSKLFLLTEGWHAASMREFLRWVQFRNDDPLVQTYKDNGYPTRELVSYSGTTIVGFPTAPTITTLGMGDKLVTAPEATPEEQFRWLQLGEKYWIDGVEENGQPVTQKYSGQISFTLKYFPDVVSMEEFKSIMLNFQSTVKCCSVMPQSDAGSYEYSPEQVVSTEEYLQIVAGITVDPNVEEDISFSHIDCASGACPITFVDKHAIQPAQEAA